VRWGMEWQGKEREGVLLKVDSTVWMTTQPDCMHVSYLIS